MSKSADKDTRLTGLGCPWFWSIHRDGAGQIPLERLGPAAEGV
jgi:hypothetical protein